MGAFTSEQQATLEAMGEVTFSYIDGVQNDLELALYRIGALQDLLFTKDMITEDELDQAIKERQAWAATRRAFTFGTTVKAIRQGMRDVFNRMVRGEREDQSNQP